MVNKDTYTLRYLIAFLHGIKVKKIIVMLLKYKSQGTKMYNNEMNSWVVYVDEVVLDPVEPNTHCL